MASGRASRAPASLCGASVSANSTEEVSHRKHRGWVFLLCGSLDEVAMMRAAIRAVAVVLALALGHLGAQPALACECPYRPRPLDALADSNAVFAGTAVRVEQPQPTLK